MNRVAIMGLGLMGGSLALALRKAGAACTIVGYARREDTGREALARGVVDEAYADPATAVKGAEVIVMCVPVLAIPDLCRRCAAALLPGAVVTDVGSTKAALLREIAGVLPVHSQFVGSHPIAGSDRTGLDAADGELYQGATCVVTPAPGSAETAVESVRSLWEQVGCHVLMLEPEEHDRLIARTSHLPHVIASVLVATVCREGCNELAPFCGGGLRDTTRVAAGSEDMWHDIAKTNAAWLHRELKAFGRVLDEMTRLLECGDFEGVRAFLADARRTRQCMGTCRNE